MAFKYAKNIAVQRLTCSSDSLSALQALNAQVAATGLILDVKNAYKQLTDAGFIVDMYWCKAHIGTIGNEAADKLASNCFNAPIITVPPPVSAFRRGVPLEVQRRWLEDPPIPSTGFLTDAFPSLSARIQSRRFNIGHYHINQFLTGHGPFRSKIYAFMNDQECMCGQGDHNERHILLDCPLVERQRELICSIINVPIQYLPRWLAEAGNNSISVQGRQKFPLARINQLLHRMQRRCPPSSDEMPP